MTHKAGRIKWDDLRHTKRYKPFQAYADSKLANLLHMKELSDRMDR